MGFNSGFKGLSCVLEGRRWTELEQHPAKLQVLNTLLMCVRCVCYVGVGNKYWKLSIQSISVITTNKLRSVRHNIPLPFLRWPQFTQNALRDRLCSTMYWYSSGNVHKNMDCSRTEFLCFSSVTSASSRWVSQIRPLSFPSTHIYIYIYIYIYIQ